MQQYWNKTKVICTIGPSCIKPGILKKMILSGMDVARFNFSHGAIEDHISTINTLKSIAEKLKSPVGILQDLPGPKIRIGLLSEDFIEIKKGQKFFLTTNDIIGTQTGVSLNNPLFLNELSKNNIVYLNDGLVKLIVTAKNKNKIMCEVLIGGMIFPKKGVSCPDKVLSFPTVTDYDLKCLEFGVQSEVDFVAVSFVQRAEDILTVKKYLKKKGSFAFVIAKIERKVAFEDIDRIIEVSDGVMVARGDLGIETSLEDVPFLQKKIIGKCNKIGRPVITATQMLESMVNNPQPTRAEVTDIANAIIDGTDALMLSEETAVGRYPVKTLQVMLNIAAKTEDELKFFPKRITFSDAQIDHNLIGAFSQATVNVANYTHAKVIVVPTDNQDSISWLSRLHPHSSIVAITTKENVFKKMILLWGVYPVMIDSFSDLGQTLSSCVRVVKSCGLACSKDKIVIMLTEDNGLFASNIMEVRTIS
ncbi:MAG: pyruvate kinase [Candidatus Omnitrophota bacterium]|nr:MAG: pyruvate kinase [Candidatus Omnitrophota bacterium]